MIPSQADPLLELEGFGVRFGQRVVLDALDLTVPARGVTALMGPGGGGKSTLVRTICGLNDVLEYMDVEGQVRRHGALRAGPPPAIVIQKPRLAMSRAFDYLIDGLPQRAELTRAEQRAWLEAFLRERGCEALLPRLDDQLIDASSAQRRMFAILRELVSDPPMLCVDEPMASFEDEQAEPILELLRQEGARRAVLVVTHHQRRARALADQVALLAGGRIIELRPAEEFFEDPREEATRCYVRTGGCDVPLPGTPPSTRASPWTRRRDRGARPLRARAGRRPRRGARPGPDRAGPERGAHRALRARLRRRRPGRRGVARGRRRAAAPPSDQAPTVEEWAEPITRPRHQLPAQAERLSLATLMTQAPPYISAAVGPNSFRWLVPGRLGGAPKPGLLRELDRDLEALERTGADTLVTLTEEPLSPGQRLRPELTNIFFPIPDMHAPPLEDAHAMCAHIAGLLARGACVVFHCKAGIGRTGTMLGATLIWHGMPAPEALSTLRGIYRAWVQSEEQEQFLVDFDAYCRASEELSLADTSSSSSLTHHTE